MNSIQVGVSNWAKHGQDGQEVASPVFPYRLNFVPTGEIAFSDEYVRPFLEDLTSIPADTTLYQIMALDKPIVRNLLKFVCFYIGPFQELGGEEKYIGDLVLRSALITSMWGDKYLYFRHDDEAHDLVIKPEWNEYTPQFGDYFEEDPSKSSKCPYSRK